MTKNFIKVVVSEKDNEVNSIVYDMDYNIIVNITENIDDYKCENILHDKYRKLYNDIYPEGYDLEWGFQ